jgi:1-deoxy-D-xylulose-5-phosphate synthase
MALLSRVPGITVFAPSSAQEVEVMLTEALSITDGPSAIRYPKGPARQAPPEEVGSGLSGRLVCRGEQVCLLGVGKMVEAAEEAARLLNQHGVSATVWDVRVVKPLDPAMIADAAGHPLVVTVEDGVRQGGAGAAIADAVASLVEGRPAPPVVVLGVPDRYIAQASPTSILAGIGLDGPGIAASVIGALEAAETVPDRS